MATRIGVYLFTNDLRTYDNLLLAKASQEVDHLICVYCMVPMSPFIKHFSLQTDFGTSRLQFSKQCLHQLNAALNRLGNKLYVCPDLPTRTLEKILSQYQITDFYCTAHSGWDERSSVDYIEQNHPNIHIHLASLTSLFKQQQLPFKAQDLPKTFSQFRKQLEILLPTILRTSELAYSSLFSPLEQALPKSLPVQLKQVELSITKAKPLNFQGGEQAGIEHLQGYFASNHASRYKQTRNQLDGMSYSTKFSPWLAHGCISPKQVYWLLKQYEQDNGANDSTYWILFELLWREYFYWYAIAYGRKLFKFSGIAKTRPLTSFYAQRFVMWSQGQTSYPLVNAFMNQLNRTGFMSNRGRQIVASCLIHEYQLDWRYGAAYFESQLIDYDVASNWGNWQYIAGVGADPRGGRHFNLNKQQQMYDSNSTFINKWQGNCHHQGREHIDLVDWPISAKQLSLDLE